MQYGEDDCCYEIFEDKKAIKFIDKHSDDEDLINRIHEKYLLLAIHPYNEAERSFKSKKCPNVKKPGLVSIESYISLTNQKEIEIIDIGPRRSIHKKWD